MIKQMKDNCPFTYYHMLSECKAACSLAESSQRENSSWDESMCWRAAVGFTTDAVRSLCYSLYFPPLCYNLSF